MYSSPTYKPHFFPSLASNSISTKPKLETQITKMPTRRRLELLASEFRSLPEPIDRVKRLLDYAEMLPELDAAARVQANKVSGCTTQVWLEAVMDKEGKMRFRADSDSEITKGFCSCLIMVLDGSEPEEVMEVKTEDLTDMNVGVYGKAVSRVNAWQNVLVGMQKKTHFLAMERDR